MKHSGSIPLCHWITHYSLRPVVFLLSSLLLGGSSHTHVWAATLASGNVRVEQEPIAIPTEVQTEDDTDTTDEDAEDPVENNMPEEMKAPDGEATLEAPKPLRHPSLSERLDLLSGFSIRHTSGRGPLVSLTLWKAVLAQGSVLLRPDQRLGFWIDEVHLDSEQKTLHGQPRNRQRKRPECSQPAWHCSRTNVETALTYTSNSSPSLTVELGTRPGRGDLFHRLVGRLRLTGTTQKNSWTLEGFSLPVKDSLLSYVGSVNPLTGHWWGQVQQSGTQLSLTHEISSHWDSTAQLSAAVVQGSHVRTNYKLAVDLDMMREVSIPVRGADELSVGPRVSVVHYDKHLGAFTLGQGGYYSPQLFVEGGPAVSFLMTMAHSFLVTGDISTGIQHSERAGRPAAALHSTSVHHHLPYALGPAVAVELGWVWRLGTHWQLVGGAGVSKEARFDERTVGIAFRYLLSARDSVVSDDLLPRLIQSVSSE